MTFYVLLSCLNSSLADRVVQNLSEEDTVVDSNWTAKDMSQIELYMVNSIKDSYYLNSNGFNRNDIWVLTKGIANDTDEHINTRVLMEKLRTKLIKNLGIRFIDDQALNEIIQQLALQEKDFYDKSKIAQLGKILGVKLILRGRLSSIRKQKSMQNFIFYNINLQLVSIETSEILWTDNFEIKRKTIASKYY